MADNTLKQSNENIIPVALSEALSSRYLSYAMSTIMSRSLPDVRDGLKPVHRRLLYAMRALKLDPKSGYKKSARVVGDVIGKYHPHGDSAVYDAMVRLAQSFAVRYPLVEGQGNFGNIDGDGAAAMRYTEAKLTDVAICLMEGLDEDAVDFMDNYDGTEQEPIVMPALFPNLLANGAMGIAVGMATNIPPHNVMELCDAINALIENPDITISGLMKYIKGPDFPTGGIICEDKSTIINVYEKGKGSLTIRCKWNVEELQYGNYQIVITEIPYQVQKAKLIEKIADLMNSGKLPLIGDIRDETTDKIRIVIEPKSRIAPAEKIMASLFQFTELEIKFNVNMNVLNSESVPMVMSIKDILQSYIDHRKEVISRQAKYRISKIDHRLEILAGYLIAYLNLDEVIEIIRNNDEPKPLLMEKFNLTDLQAESILNMKLRSLSKLEEMEIKAEDKALKSDRKTLSAMIATDESLLKKVSEDTLVLKERFGANYANWLGKRQTKIDSKAPEMTYDEKEFIIKEQVSVILSTKGWIKYMKGHIDNTNISVKDGDSVFDCIHCQNTDKLLVFTDNGRCFTKDIMDLPSGRGYGEPLALMLEMNDASIVSIMAYNESMADNYVVIASTAGYGFKCKMSNLIASTKNGKAVLNIDTERNDKMLSAIQVKPEDDMIAVVSTSKMLLMFGLNELPEMTKGKGVVLQKYTDNKTKLSDIILFSKKEGLNFKKGTSTFNAKDIKFWVSKRGNVGKMPFDGFPKSCKFK